MNINALIKDVTIRIVKGERVRVKKEYKDTIFESVTANYPVVKIYVDSGDGDYVYIRKVHDVQPGFTPEDMARAVRDCNGNPVTSEEGVVTGYGFKGYEISDTTSTQCLCRQVIFTDRSKNEYYLGIGRDNRLYDPTQMIDGGRLGWIRCDASQFHTYLRALKTGNTFELGQIRNELNID